jgi:hypothetical protein
MANPNPTHKFQKGESGNPGGRPKREWTFMGLYEEELEKILTTKDGQQIEAKKAVAKRLVQMAIEGDINAIKELANRIEGMPQQKTDITTGGESINIRIVSDDGSRNSTGN